MSKNKEVLDLAMDGTSYDEYRIVDNKKYSEQIITAARAASDPKKREELKKSSNLDEYLAESKKQVLAQWHADQAIAVHSDMFRVLCQINAGEILNEVESMFGKKSAYMEWIKNNFEDRHLRYFQQAKQLADMGEFAKTYAAVGKNRLLALESLRKVERKKECLVLFKDHPLPDMADDDEGKKHKRHIDSVVTFHRLKNAGIRFATFKQADLVASTLNDAVGVQKAEQIQKWLSTNEESQRPVLFDRYIQDQLAFPSDHPYTPAPKASLDKILADLLRCYGTGNLEDKEWIEKQRKIVDVNTLESAQKLISDLLEKLTIKTAATEAEVTITPAV
jgi:hypothetical protein